MQGGRWYAVVVVFVMIVVCSTAHPTGTHSHRHKVARAGHLHLAAQGSDGQTRDRAVRLKPGVDVRRKRGAAAAPAPYKPTYNDLDNTASPEEYLDHIAAVVAQYGSYMGILRAEWARPEYTAELLASVFSVYGVPYIVEPSPVWEDCWCVAVAEQPAVWVLGRLEQWEPIQWEERRPKLYHTKYGYDAPQPKFPGVKKTAAPYAKGKVPSPSEPYPALAHSHAHHHHHHHDDHAALPDARSPSIKGLPGRS